MAESRRTCRAVSASAHTIGSVERRDIDAFVRRDWERTATAKRQYWVDRFQREGWRPAWDAAQALLAHVRRVRPDYPADAERRRDIEDHQALRATLDRLADAFLRR